MLGATDWSAEIQNLFGDSDNWQLFLQNQKVQSMVLSALQTPAVASSIDSFLQLNPSILASMKNDLKSYPVIQDELSKYIPSLSTSSSPVLSADFFSSPLIWIGLGVIGLMFFMKKKKRRR